MTPVRRRLHPWIVAYGPVVGLSLLAGFLAWWSSRAVYPAFSWNRDEPVYLWQMRTLRAGSFSTPDGGFPTFFHPWLSIADDGRLYSQYTLGWPSVLVLADALFGDPSVGMAIGAALAVSGTYACTRVLSGDRMLAIAAGGVLAVSPIIIVQGGVYLGYLFTLGLGMWFGAALVSGVRDGRRWRLLAAGLLLSAILITRQFDALLWAAAFGIPILVQHRRSLAPLLRRSVPWFVIGALPLTFLTLAYNHRMTGNFAKFPVTVKDPLDTFGFGTRRIAPQFGEVDYGPVQAIKGTLKNGFYLLLFALGGLVALPVALLGWWQRRREGWTWPIVAIGIAFPVGYFGFWGTNVSSITSRISGPIYFVPLYAVLAIFVAQVIVAAGRRRRAAGVALAVVLVLAGLPLAINRIDTNHRISAAQEPWEHASRDVTALEHDSLVFVADSGPYLMFLNPYSANQPDLDGPVVWATEQLGHDVDLIRAYPERTPYRMQASFRGDELGPDEQPKIPEIELLPLEVVDGSSLRIAADIQNTTALPFVVVTVTLDGRVIDQRVISKTSSNGARHDFEWVLHHSPRTNGPDSANESVVSGNYGALVVSVGFGADRRTAARPLVQRVVGYSGQGVDLAAVVPARGERLSDIGGPKLRWRPTTDLPEITVTITPA
jgi:4-amino-4-deoxy-L-arabinose transferase-like glycosyltransferase